MPTSKEYMPQYPFYIISKGRSELKGMTASKLEEMGLDFKIAVETHEYEAYCATWGEERILKLPFSNHGKGSGPARNYCWEHSIDLGFKRHWLLDDNIHNFYRYHNNRRLRIKSAALFKSIEDFVDRYTNVALAGPQYKSFCTDNMPVSPVKLNTRLMSCILINNELPHRWRARYNEDVDLSLRVLKDGWCTMMFYHFLQHKAQTQTIKGGNTEEIYGRGTYDKSKMLVQLHPDVVRMADRYGRDHHHVDIRPFQHIMPILREGIEIEQGVNEYGLVHVEGYGTDSARKTPCKPR